jgi:hypothetical protein
LLAFFADRKRETLDRLMDAVQQSSRDTMKEARLAGMAEAYTNAMMDLQKFADDALKGVSQ